MTDLIKETVSQERGVVVIKYGGAAMNNPEIVSGLLKTVVELLNEGFPLILVHGGGPEIDVMLKRLQIEPARKNGLRVTDAPTMEVVEMVLAGKVNKNLVAQIQYLGGRAAGICGKDGNLVRAQKKSGDTDLGQVGEVLGCDTTIIDALLGAGILPVISSVASDNEGKSLNINADEMASALAATLKADLFILLTDVPGVMASYPDESTIISRMSRNEASDFLSSGKADRGMRPKIEACLDAVNRGVKDAVISDGRNPLYLKRIILKDFTHGTRISSQP